MKRILIFSHAMEIGGAEKALLGLLENIDTNKYLVDLFLMRHTGELMKYIPDNINLLPELPEYASLAVPIQSVIKKRQFAVAFRRTMGKIKAQRKVKQLNLPPDHGVALEYSHKYTRTVMPEIQPHIKYDLAISFLTPHYFVTEKVNAKKKIAWIHTDYKKMRVDIESELQMWGKYDNIISISNSVTERFLDTFPTLEHLVQTWGNIMPLEYMRNMAGAFSVEDEMPNDGTLKILSIGRFCTSKNFDNVPRICTLIREQGINVRWYLIGYGSDEQLIRMKIIQADMQEYVIMLGKKENPYPYIKKCDLYVQPSRYEGKSVSVIEAQILHKPVVITNYTTAESQLRDDYDGVIVPMNNDECAKGIVRLLRDKNKMQRLIENTMMVDYSNKETVKNLYEIIENSK